VWKAPEKTGQPSPHACSTGFPVGTAHNVHAAFTVGHWGCACAPKALDNKKPAIPKVTHTGFIMTSSYSIWFSCFFSTFSMSSSYSVCGEQFRTHCAIFALKKRLKYGVRAL
jgi:hypothetical protein